MRSFSVKLFSIILIAGLGIIAYSNSFHCSFHFDDKPSIIDNFAIRNIHHLQNIWDFLPRRFMLYLSIAFNYHFSALDVFSYHLFNLAVHLAAAILAWWLVRLTLSTPVMKEEKIACHIDIISLLVALVFVAHPIQTESVTYIVQRAASMATLFYLASLSLYVQSRLLEDKKSVIMQKFYYIGSLITAIVAMFTKETAITIPLMILLYEFSFFKTKKNFQWDRVIPFLLIIFIIPLIMLLTETSPERIHQLRSEPGISSIHYLFTQFRVIVTYIRLAFLPLNQNLDYDYPISRNFFELPTLISFLLLVMVLFCAQRLFLKFRLVAFAIFWFFLTLLPESSILPIKDVIYEHRLYLPLVGYCLFLVSSMYYLFGKNNIGMMIIVLIGTIGIYSVLTYQRNKVWKNEFTLWDDTVHKSPHKARPYYNLGHAYDGQRNYTKAMSNYDKAIEMDPNYERAYDNRGNIYAKRGNFTQAMLDFDKTIELDPNDAEAYYNRGLSNAKQNNLSKAIFDYDRAIAVNPNYEDAYYNRGLGYAKEGDFTEALADFTKAIELNPKVDDEYNNRGLILEKMGEFDQAVSDYNEAIALKPNNAEAYANRGFVFYKLGNFNLAIFDYNRAIKINPQYSNAYYYRGNAFKRQENFIQAISDYKEAIKINPNYGEAFYNLGNTYYERGNLIQALLVYNKVIEVGSDIIQVYNNRAIVYYQLGKYDQAWRDVYKAEELGVSINPDLISGLQKNGARGDKVYK